MPFWLSQGFGLGTSMVMDAEKHQWMGAGGEGSFGWPGAFGTWWQADPVNDLAMIYLIQHQVPVSANSGSTIATGRGAAGRGALPVYQRGIYDALGDEPRLERAG